MFGDDDIIADRPYKASLISKQNDSYLYQIPRADFLRIFRVYGDAWTNLCKLSQKKENQNVEMQQNFYSVNLSRSKEKLFGVKENTYHQPNNTKKLNDIIYDANSPGELVKLLDNVYQNKNQANAINDKPVSKDSNTSVYQNRKTVSVQFNLRSTDNLKVIDNFTLQSGHVNLEKSSV